jgi:hypothetical protein
MAADIEVDGRQAITSLRALNGAFMHSVAETTRVTLEEVERHAKATTLFNDKSGAGVTRAGEGTRSSIKAHVEGTTRGFVEAGGAAQFLENGTQPHEIWAHGGGMLRFEVAGTVFFRRMVHHPGTAPRPFMQQARDHGQQVADFAAEIFLEEAIRRHP